MTYTDEAPVFLRSRSNMDEGHRVDIEIRVLGRDELAMLDAVADDVFDGPVHLRWAAEFLADPRHHLAVAIVDGVIVGMASGVHYVHPDKPPELWVNEVGVAPAYQNQGIGKRLLRTLFARGLELGCAIGWVGTEVENEPARRLYRAVGGVEEPTAFIMVSFTLMGDDSSTGAENIDRESNGFRQVDG